jgi:type IV pilus assembly protein PilA
MLKTIKFNDKGMTLVELLAVIVILGIISAIAVVNITQVVQKSKDQAMVSNAMSLSESAKMYLHSMSLSNELSPNKITYRTLYDENYLEMMRDPDTGEILDPESNESYAIFEGKKITAICLKGSKRSLCPKDDPVGGILLDDLSTDLITANN